MSIDPHDEAEPAVGDHIRDLELNGYTVLPRLLSDEWIGRLRAAADSLPLNHTSYSDAQWYCHDAQWKCAQPAFGHLVAYDPMLRFLDAVFGDGLACTGVTFARTDPGYPGMALHTDSQPYGSNIFGPRGSSPCMLRVLYYLDDLTADCSPLRVVPSSHLSLHADAQPYRRYKCHPEEIEVTCAAGSAIVINQRLFHAVGANRSARSRRVVAVSYRPGWAAPVAEVPPFASEDLEKLPPRASALFGDPNRGLSSTQIVNWHDQLPTDANGLGPRRWLRRG